MKSKIVLTIMLTLTVLVTVSTVAYVVFAVKDTANGKVIPSEDANKKYLFK
jgi:hypothetical protein